jgi:hypothetical protein
MAQPPPAPLIKRCLAGNELEKAELGAIYAGADEDALKPPHHPKSLREIFVYPFDGLGMLHDYRPLAYFFPFVHLCVFLLEAIMPTLTDHLNLRRSLERHIRGLIFRHALQLLSWSLIVRCFRLEPTEAVKRELMCAHKSTQPS